MKVLVPTLLYVLVVCAAGKERTLSTPITDHKENLALLNRLNLQSKKVTGVPNVISVGHLNTPTAGNVQVTYNPGRYSFGNTLPFASQPNVVPLQFTYNPPFTNDVTFGNQILPYSSFYYPTFPLGQNYATNFYTYPLANAALPSQTGQVLFNTLPVGNLATKNAFSIPSVPSINSNALTVNATPLVQNTAQLQTGQVSTAKNIEPNPLSINAITQSNQLISNSFKPISPQISTPINNAITFSSGLPLANTFNNVFSNQILTPQTRIVDPKILSPVPSQVSLQRAPEVPRTLQPIQATHPVQVQTPAVTKTPIHFTVPVSQTPQLFVPQTYTFGVQQPAQAGLPQPLPFGLGAQPPQFTAPHLQFGAQSLQFGQQPLQFGSQPLQTGQQSIQVGQQPLQTGQQLLQFGSQPLQTGQQPIQLGSQPLQVGQQVQIGPQPLQTGQQLQFSSQPLQTGQQQLQFGSRLLQTGQQPLQLGSQPLQVGQQPVQTVLQPPIFGAVPNANAASFTSQIKASEPFTSTTALPPVNSSGFRSGGSSGDSTKRGVDSSIGTVTGNGLLPPLTPAEEISREEFRGLLKSYVSSRDGGVVGYSNINKFQNGDYHKV